MLSGSEILGQSVKWELLFAMSSPGVGCVNWTGVKVTACWLWLLRRLVPWGYVLGSFPSLTEFPFFLDSYQPLGDAGIITGPMRFSLGRQYHLGATDGL